MGAPKTTRDTPKGMQRPSINETELPSLFNRKPHVIDQDLTDLNMNADQFQLLDGKSRLFYGLAKNLRGTVPVHRYMRNGTGPRTGVVKNRWSRSLSLSYILSSKVSFRILFLHLSIRCTHHHRKDYDEKKAVVVSKRHYQGCHLNAKRAST